MNADCSRRHFVYESIMAEFNASLRSYETTSCQHPRGSLDPLFNYFLLNLIAQCLVCSIEALFYGC